MGQPKETQTTHFGDVARSDSQLEFTSLKTSLDEVTNLIPNTALSQKISHTDRKNEAHFGLAKVFSSNNGMDCQHESPWPEQPANTAQWSWSWSWSQSMISAAAAPTTSIYGFTRRKMEDGSSYPNSADLHDGDDLAAFAGRKFFVVDNNNNKSSCQQCRCGGSFTIIPDLKK
jgi:hypothetical protein